MTYQRNRRYRWVRWGGLVGVALLFGANPAPAQTTGGGGATGGSSSGGSAMSGGFGSQTGASSSGSSNLNYSNPTFNQTHLPGISQSGNLPGLITTNTGNTSSGRGTFGSTNTAVTQYNPFSPYYSNPLALGYPGTTSAYGV